MQSNYKYLADVLRRQIEDTLFRVGILCRVFSRGKDEKSLNDKLTRETNKYSITGKLIQDTIGIRVALYFSEDIEVVKQLLCDKYEVDKNSSVIDTPKTDQFTVSRYNLIFKTPSDYINEHKIAIGKMPIDYCFEVQLRSILSEGWHEVEHDLRYKSKSYWEGQDDLSRMLNGIVATLETAEWSMRRIFDDLAYRHYKNKNWIAMLHSKLRMRVAPHLSHEILTFLNENNDAAKDASRIDRIEVIRVLSQAKPRIPVTLDNIIYIWNLLHKKDLILLKITPNIISTALEDLEYISV
ncbi:MAG: RelA/SpoT domain-containing protein [Rhodoferax sp.]|uniref:RelA/SpoT domain-containing protein n=1 Tax=Rhodoferax sp. TaxID=50421 RepID=UPI0026082FA2|nr:RelA/SpoT domain-containing protein [Rhodoferax sp.]MDD2878840.1 RelA/SpoT domain-containing protein [Rhodoferax sp.]